jgi:hypothetical protein
MLPSRAMCSDDLTSEQIAELINTLARHARFLSRLVERMDKLRWAKDDVLYTRTLTARDAMMSLLASVHAQARKSPSARLSS